MDDWLSFAVDAIGGVCALICLFEGARRLGAHGVRRTAALMAGLGALYCLLYGGYFLVKHQETRDYARALYPEVYRTDLPADWGNQLPPARREAGSMALARSAFVESGTLRSYFDATGAKKPFAPSQADVKRRDRVVASQARLEASSTESLERGLAWLIWGVMAAFFGFGVSREKQKA
jgi:hypothetical protein